jgi:hypothetical protein
MMRWFAACAIASLLFLVNARAQDQTLFTDVAAENLFRYSRMAVGTGPAVAGLRSLVLKGRSRLLVDSNAPLASATVEIRLLLPDHYLRIDTIGTAERRAGYAGNAILSSIRDGANVSYPPDQLRRQLLQNGRFHVIRFLLGAVTYVTPELVLTFHSVPKSVEMVDPRISARTTTAVDMSGNLEPYTANVTGEEFDARFIIDGTTRMPSRIEYHAADKKDMVLRFEDRRRVAGLLLPFHIVTTSAGRVVDEVIFDQILVNSELSKGDFKP